MVGGFRRGGGAGALLALLVLAAALPAAAAPPVDAGRSGTRPGAPAADAVDGELIVKFVPGTRAADRDRVLDEVDADAVARVADADVVAVEAGDEEALAAELSADPDVEYAEPNYLRTAFAEPEEGWGVRAVKARKVWESPQGWTGDGVRIAVLDSGVSTTAKGMRRAAGDNFSGQQSSADQCGHGTAVASIAAGARNGSSVVGVAPEATVVPVKVLQYDPFNQGCFGTDSGIARGIRWAADPETGRADIINLSLGGPQRSRTISDAVGYAVSQGVLVVAASGNAGDLVPNYPAALPDVVSVGALRSTGAGPEWAKFSSFGSVDIAAAGRNVPAQLASNVPADRVGAKCRDRSDVVCVSGTSFAAPHVAGVAALLIQQHRAALATGGPRRVRLLRQWLLGTAGDLAPSGVDVKTGHGQPDALAAANAADRAELITWQAQRRVISETSATLAVPATTTVTATLTNGAGEPIVGRALQFAPATGGAVFHRERVTGGAGQATTTFRSTAGGRHTKLVVTGGPRPLGLQVYVRAADDNIPGVRPRPSGQRGAVDPVFDTDDVYRHRLRAGETLRGRLRGVDMRSEYVDMVLHRPTARDVTSYSPRPLRENTDRLEFDPLRLERTVSRDGVYFLNVYGAGSYRLTWDILSPGRISRGAATPSTFTPNGDGVGDSTRITWRTASRGSIVVRVRNADGKVVRTARLGARPRGAGSFRWNGRNNAGRLLGSGTYRVRIDWSNASGRVDSTSTRVRLRR